MTAPTYAGVVTQGAQPSGGAVSFTQPAGDAFAFLIAMPLGVTPATPSGFALLGSRTVDYVDFFVFGRNGGGGSTVTVTGVTNQAAIAGVSFSGASSDWLTARVLALGPDGSLSVMTGPLPVDSLLVSFLAATDNTTAITTTAPSGMTKRGEVSAQFNFRHAAVATSTPGSQASQNLTWACATPASASFAAVSLAIPGVTTAIGPTILRRSSDGTTWERRKLLRRNLAGNGWDWETATSAPSSTPALPTVADGTTSTAGMTALFADDFTAAGLDGTKWLQNPWYESGSYAGGEGTVSWHQKPYDSLQFSTSGGIASLKMRRRTGLPGQPSSHFFTGMLLNTDATDGGSGVRFALPANSTTFSEVRCQVPTARAAWCAFWLMGLGSSWPSIGEVDIFETFNTPTATGKPFANMHWYDASYAASENQGHLQAFGLDMGTLLTGGFHTVGLYRSPTVMRWYVDGVLKLTRTKGQVIAGWNNPPPDLLWTDPMMLLLDAKTGGDAGAGWTTAQYEDGDFLVDYVKVWEAITAPQLVVSHEA